jgi:hypothetical protein
MTAVDQLDGVRRLELHQQRRGELACRRVSRHAPFQPLRDTRQLGLVVDGLAEGA